MGTKEDWSKIAIDESKNEALFQSKLYYYSEEAPSEKDREDIVFRHQYWKRP